jgi:transcriptional regulator with XRE-family HTH domain
MTEPTTLGADLRRERERRGLALKSISEDTKVSIALLEGLEADDISRWPGGIFQRAFVRAYAQCVGLDADDVFRRFQKQFPPDGAESLKAAVPLGPNTPPASTRSSLEPPQPTACIQPLRARVLGTAADLTVALVFAFGCAAAGSRLLWPVLLIACYYAAGVLLTGTSPMVALLGQTAAAPAKAKEPVTPAPPAVESPDLPARQLSRGPSRLTSDRPVRQRRGMQAPV